VLCKGLPDEMSIYLNYCKSLRFEDKPDYDFLKGLFSKLVNSYIESYILHNELLKFDRNFSDKNYVYNILEKKSPKIRNMLKKETRKDGASMKFSPKVGENILTPIENIENIDINNNDQRNSDYNIFNELATNMNNMKIKGKTMNSDISSEDSAQTEKNEIHHDKVDLQLSDDGKSGDLEDIDHVINRIKKTKKSFKKSDLSDDTIEVKQNMDKIDMNKNLFAKNNNESDSDNSFINFVNLKKNKTILEHENKHDDTNDANKHSRKFLPFKTYKEESNFEN